MAKMQKIVPNLWFDTEAEEAASFYTSISRTPESQMSCVTERQAHDQRGWS
jgi:predicted 3-demethylubiquinone-9 3-methyltransferase (glyoxalase superfamily)